MITAIICITIVLLAIVSLRDIRNTKKTNFTKKFNSEIFKTLGLPIVTFKCNGTDLTFLVDTGSNKSHLKLGVAERINAIRVARANDIVITTGNGVVQHHGYYNVSMTLFNTTQITQEFEIMDLEDTFSDWGISVDGILGVDFLVRSKYILDFQNKVMYVKN